MKNSLVDSSIMAHIEVGGPLWGESMKVMLESFLLGERLRPPKQSAMNSRLPKRTVSSRRKPPHIKCSPLVETLSAEE
jgi:hypothetical protein